MTNQDHIYPFHFIITMLDHVGWVAWTYATRMAYQYFVQGMNVLNFKADVLLCVYASLYFYCTALFSPFHRLLMLGVMQGYLVMAPPSHGSIQSALNELLAATFFAACMIIVTFILST